MVDAQILVTTHLPFNQAKAKTQTGTYGHDTTDTTPVPEPLPTLSFVAIDHLPDGSSLLATCPYPPRTRRITYYHKVLLPSTLA